jgi:hypothetical protein
MVMITVMMGAAEESPLQALEAGQLLEEQVK